LWFGKEDGMKDGRRARGGQPVPSIPNRILGSLRDALAAASRDVTGEAPGDERTELLPRDRPAGDQSDANPHTGSVPAGANAAQRAQGQSAAEALRAAKSAAPPVPGGDGARTQLVRGNPKVAHGDFHQDPVVGWLVVVGGLGLGAFRPIYEGNNAIGRNAMQRIAIDFGDDTISAEEQAYIRYDSMDRSFLFVPNLAKTNIVAVNNNRPTSAVKLQAMDMITMGRTQLAFVPFCGEDFDWSELAGLKE
jgi:hypothetical protein